MTTIERAREFANSDAGEQITDTYTLMAAFHEFMAAWTVISSEADLPKESGKYWWTSRKFGRVMKIAFDIGECAGDPEWISEFYAWMPYTEPPAYRPTGGDDASA